jgi:hypothetical protein
MCGEFKSLEEFHRNRARSDGRQNACKPCNIERNKRWYREHPEARRKRMDGYAKNRRLRLQRQLLEYLQSHPCVDCGESDPVVLEFDHVRDKVANVSALIHSHRPWSVIVSEIEKCQVRCANCHRRKTCERVASFRFVKRIRVGAEGLEPSTCGLKVRCAHHCATPPKLATVAGPRKRLGGGGVAFL